MSKNLYTDGQGYCLINKPHHIHKQQIQQTKTRASKQTHKQTNKQTSKQASKQTNRTNRHTNKQLLTGIANSKAVSNIEDCGFVAKHKPVMT
jgi:hypothetical protein